MSALDTRVDGDVESVRGTATGLSSLGDGIDDAGTGFGQASAASESSWLGPAGDAFRSRIGTAHQATSTAAASARRMATALHRFADRMATVKAEVARARSIAAGADLDVSGDSIQEPAPPPAAPTGVLAPQAAAQAAHQQAAAEAKYRRQLRAYRQAEKLLTEARKQEQTAHQQVTTASEDEGGVLAELDDPRFWLLGGQATGVPALSLAQRTRWLGRTQELAQEYDELRTAASAEDKPAMRTLLNWAADRKLDQGGKASAAADDNAGITDVDPDSGLGKAIGRAPDVFALAQGVWDVANAKGTKAKVVAGAADAGGYLAGSATTAALSSALEAAAIGGAPETLGLSLVAGGVAYGTGLAIQAYGPAAYDWSAHQIDALGGTIHHAAGVVSSTVHHDAGVVSGAVTHGVGVVGHDAGSLGSTIGHGAGVVGSTIGHDAGSVGGTVAGAASTAGDTVGHAVTHPGQTLDSLAGDIGL